MFSSWEQVFQSLDASPITEFDHLWWRRCFECSASVCEASWSLFCGGAGKRDPHACRIEWWCARAWGTSCQAQPDTTHSNRKSRHGRGRRYGEYHEARKEMMMGQGPSFVHSEHDCSFVYRLVVKVCPLYPEPPQRSTMRSWPSLTHLPLLSCHLCL